MHMVAIVSLAEGPFRLLVTWLRNSQWDLYWFTLMLNTIFWHDSYGTHFWLKGPCPLVTQGHRGRSLFVTPRTSPVPGAESTKSVCDLCLSSCLSRIPKSQSVGPRPYSTSCGWESKTVLNNMLHISFVKKCLVFHKEYPNIKSNQFRGSSSLYIPVFLRCSCHSCRL